MCVAAVILFLLLPGTVTLAIPIYFLCKQGKEGAAKTFTEDAGDNDVLAFCSKEESMAYRGIKVEGGNNRITRVSLVVISRRCI